MSVTRRDLLERCLALGGVSVASAVAPSLVLGAWAEQEKAARAATPKNELGPFYKKKAPANAVLRAEGDPGLPLSVSGRVWSARGQPLPGALVELWHTDHRGHYDLDGYRYRASLPADSDGKYAISTVMPGHYPDRVCQHIHYLVTAPGHKPLITQLYFATDPVFEGDPDRNFGRDPLVFSRELVRPVVLSGDPKEVGAAVQFELVLEAL
jgi:protocatechuate 3,4-dioxygenase beta subunit